MLLFGATETGGTVHCPVRVVFSTARELTPKSGNNFTMIRVPEMNSSLDQDVWDVDHGDGVWGASRRVDYLPLLVSRDCRGHHGHLGLDGYRRQVRLPFGLEPAEQLLLGYVDPDERERVIAGQRE